MSNMNVALDREELATVLDSLIDYIQTFKTLVSSVYVEKQTDPKRYEKAALRGLMALFVTAWDALVSFERGKRRECVDPLEISDKYKSLLTKYVENVSYKKGPYLKKSANEEEAKGVTLLKMRNAIAHGKAQLEGGTIRFRTDLGKEKKRAAHEATMTEANFWLFSDHFARTVLRYVILDEVTKRQYTLEEAEELCSLCDSDMKILCEIGSCAEGKACRKELNTSSDQGSLGSEEFERISTQV